MRIILLLSLILILSSCKTIETVEDEVTVHPNLPRPINSLQIEWNVIEYSDKIYVATTYEEFLDYLQFNQDVIRYINQLNKTVCFYRTDLDDTICLDKDQEEKNN